MDQEMELGRLDVNIMLIFVLALILESIAFVLY